MLETVKKLRMHVTFGAVATIFMGILFLVWADSIVQAFAWVIGVVLVLIGVTQFLGKLFSDYGRASGMLVGGLITVIGAWVILHQKTAAGIVPMLIGVVLVVHGIQGISLAFSGRAARMPKWWVGLIIGILDIILGIICIVCAFRLVTLALQIMGVMMIYDGITSCLFVFNVNRAEKDIIDSRIISERTDDI